MSKDYVERINYLDEKIHELVSGKQSEVEVVDNFMSVIDGLNLPESKVEELYRELYHTIRAIRVIE